MPKSLPAWMYDLPRKGFRVSRAMNDLARKSAKADASLTDCMACLPDLPYCTSGVNLPAVRARLTLPRHGDASIGPTSAPVILGLPPAAIKAVATADLPPENESKSNVTL